jgi:hypothetical protein
MFYHNQWINVGRQRHCRQSVSLAKCVSTDGTEQITVKDGRSAVRKRKQQVQDVVARCVGIGTKTRQERTRVIGHAQNHHVNKVLSDTEVQVVEIPGAQVRVRVRPYGRFTICSVITGFIVCCSCCLRHRMAYFCAVRRSPGSAAVVRYVRRAARYTTSPSDLALAL